MGVDFFTIDGVSSKDFGAMIADGSTYGAPSRSYESVKVPGRNGNVIFDNGRYENTQVTYDVLMPRAKGNIDAFRAWFMSHTWYCRIEDTFHPEEYRIGKPTGDITPTVVVNPLMAKFKVTFDCKPQRFLKSGEEKITFTSDSQIKNSTLYSAKPLIRIYGNGEVGIGADTVSITGNIFPYIDLDCEIEDAYVASYNANKFVTLSGTHYPVFNPGENGITLGSGVTKIVITPRWWTL